ncbi:MAG: LuxR C-terminal-related transcriptional regulator [Bacillota bacterium]
MEESRLTPRQKEVLHYLLQGHNTTHIAKCLYLSKETVREHVKNIYSILGARNHTECVLVALRLDAQRIK